MGRDFCDYLQYLYCDTCARERWITQPSDPNMDTSPYLETVSSFWFFSLRCFLWYFEVVIKWKGTTCPTWREPPASCAPPCLAPHFSWANSEMATTVSCPLPYLSAVLLSEALTVMAHQILAEHIAFQCAKQRSIFNTSNVVLNMWISEHMCDILK